MTRTLVRNRLGISDDDFVIAYCKASHVKELVDSLDVPPHTVRNKIQSLRKKGVDLPPKPRAPRVIEANEAEVERLNALVRQHSAGPAQ